MARYRTRDSSEERPVTESHQHIVKAGLRVLSDETRNLDARTVAKEAGKALGTVTHHFKVSGVGGLRSEMATEGFRMLGAELEKAGRGKRDPIEGLYAVGVAYIRFAESNPRLYRLMFAENWAPDTAKAFEEARQPALDLLNRAAATRQIEGGDLAMLRWAGTALLHGLATLYITGNLPKRRLKSLVRETLGYILEGARPT